jgi:LPXTG-site transpeptidase (sortase) family protein
MFNINNRKEFLINSGYFISVTLAIFVVTYFALYIFGLVPSSLGGPQEIEELDDYWVGGYDLIEEYTTDRTRPSRIIIDKVGVDTIVEQPDTRDVTILDQYLTRGAVHYPGSGTVEQGNIFVFGHSTGLRVVQNQAYKTFNDIENLNDDDEIRVEAEGKIYIYKVNSVELLDEDDALITFDNSKRSITLSTCNTFGSKQERWVVKADFYREI